LVDQVLAAPGRPLDAHTRAFMEPRLGYDFSQVRIHADERAAQSADALDARAWTFGSDIAFASGAFAPASPHGAALLAHELSHVVQQRGMYGARVNHVGAANDHAEREADTGVAALASGRRPALSSQPAPALRRSFVSGLLDVLLFIPRLFGLEYFPAEDLREYLGGLRQRKGPERGVFSDNKARACVSREGELGPYDTQTKVWLVQDMLDGHVSFLDEGSIIDLLRRSQDRAQIVAAVGRDKLWAKFDGRNRRIVEALTLSASDAGQSLVSRLRNLSPDELRDYASNVTDPALQESVRQATALSNITAPVPDSAAIDTAGNAAFSINGVSISVQPDRINPALGDHAFTHSDFQWAAPQEVAVTTQSANQPVGAFAPVEVRLILWTEFASEEAKRKSSGYGVGTRPQDQPTLRFHERAHGEGWFDFLRNNRPPAFTGTASMLPAQFNSAVQQWKQAMQDYGHRAGDFSLRAGDCVGRLPTDEQLRGTGFTSAICREVPTP
jgi:hypothetical protein